MGKGKKRSGKDKESSRNNSDTETKEETPLPKLVLKVGKEKKAKMEGVDPTGQDVEHSHHKKKKKKHKHRNEETAEKKPKKIKESTDSTEADPSTKKIHVRVPKNKEKMEVYKEPEISAFNLCLENLHRNLQRKDVYGIFTFPVTDMIAPGYSKIIKSPMDFLTMSRKIGEKEYNSLDQFRNDYVVMCNNAMLYNGSDTIYYKSAEKMLSLGLKMLSKEKLGKLNKSLGVASDSEEDVMIDEMSDVNIDSTMSTEEATSSPRRHSHPKKRKERPVSVTASILAAARKARENLMKKQPDQLYGYLSNDSEGKTSLNNLNPDTSEENKTVPVTIGNQVVTLGSQVGKLQSGILPDQCVIKEEKKNKVVPVNYLLYGPYGSFGPTYDSSLCNTTKEESDLLLQAYGSEGGIEYVKSITKFTADAPFARDYVDGILNTLTGGAHKKITMEKSQVETKDKKPEVPLDEKENRENSAVTDAKVESELNTNKNNKDATVPKDVDISSLLTLNGVGIDVSFLKNMVKPTDGKEGKNESTQAKNAELLQNLKESQINRLAFKHGGIVPTQMREVKVPTTITDNHMGMITPKDVVSSEGVRKVVGMGMHVDNSITTNTL